MELRVLELWSYGVFMELSMIFDFGLNSHILQVAFCTLLLSRLIFLLGRFTFSFTTGYPRFVLKKRPFISIVVRRFYFHFNMLKCVPSIIEWKFLEYRETENFSVESYLFLKIALPLPMGETQLTFGRQNSIVSCIHRYLTMIPHGQISMYA